MYLVKFPPSFLFHLTCRYVEYADQTAILREGYWASYNIPFYESIYNTSGYPSVVKRVGPVATHELYPRAKIFRRDQGNVRLFKTVMLMLHKCL